jgi:hypothetical protein
MVFGHPNTLETVLLREIDFPQRLRDDFAVRRGAAAGEELEDADVHDGFPFVASEILSFGFQQEVTLAAKDSGRGAVCKAGT